MFFFLIFQPLEQAIADHQSTVTAVNTTGDEIIKNSSVVESEILRDKLDALNRRWKIICTEMADRRERWVKKGSILGLVFRIRK